MENNISKVTVPRIDTLDATFAKYGPDRKCEHGKSSVWQCQECQDRREAESKQREQERQEWLDWADFHDLVLNG